MAFDYQTVALSREVFEELRECLDLQGLAYITVTDVERRPVLDLLGLGIRCDDDAAGDDDDADDWGTCRDNYGALT